MFQKVDEQAHVHSYKDDYLNSTAYKKMMHHKCQQRYSLMDFASTFKKMLQKNAEDEDEILKQIVRSDFFEIMIANVKSNETKSKSKYDLVDLTLRMSWVDAMIEESPEFSHLFEAVKKTGEHFLPVKSEKINTFWHIIINYGNFDQNFEERRALKPEEKFHLTFTTPLYKTSRNSGGVFSYCDAQTLDAITCEQELVYVHDHEVVSVREPNKSNQFRIDLAVHFTSAAEEDVNEKMMEYVFLDALMEQYFQEIQNTISNEDDNSDEDDDLGEDEKSGEEEEEESDDDQSPIEY